MKPTTKRKIALATSIYGLLFGILLIVLYSLDAAPRPIIRIISGAVFIALGLSSLYALRRTR